MDATKRPWVIQKLNHAENEPWYQIGWLENGNEVGPICELSGGAVRSKLPVWHPVAEFKYLITEEKEIEANARLIVTAVNHFEEMVKAFQLIGGWSKCQCTAKHGDNMNCPVLIAESALAKIKEG